MVSLIRQLTRDPGTSAPTPEPKRRPFMILVAVSALLATAVWLVVFRTAEDIGNADGITCPAPPESAGSSFRVLPGDSLDAVAPIAPQDVRVRVLNANGVAGQATNVSAQLVDMGFRPADPASDNDSVYGDAGLDCRGQIRFGDTGEASAASVAIALPCMEIVNDGRADAEVDVALGTFTTREPDIVERARKALDHLRAGEPLAERELADIRASVC